MGIPILRPPTVEEASSNAEGNKTIAKPILDIAKETADHTWKTLVGVPRFVFLDVPSELLARSIDLSGNIVGLYSIGAYRVAKYVRDAREGIKNVLSLGWLKKQFSGADHGDHGHGHAEAHAAAH